MRGKETMMKTREEMEKKMLCKRIDFFANREEICNALVGIKSGTEICKFYKDKKQHEQERSKILKKLHVQNRKDLIVKYSMNDTASYNV